MGAFFHFPICQHTSASASISQHTSAYVSIHHNGRTRVYLCDVFPLSVSRFRLACYHCNWKFYQVKRRYRERVKKIRSKCDISDKCQMGVSEGGVNIKDPVPLNIMDWEWGAWSVPLLKWNVVIFHQSLNSFFFLLEIPVPIMHEVSMKALKQS